MSQTAIPAPVEDRRRRIGLIDTELAILDREIAAGADHAARRDELAAERTPWRRAGGAGGALGGGAALVAEIAATRGRIEAAGRGADVAADRAALSRLASGCKALQGEQPLVFPWWTARRSPRS